MTSVMSYKNVLAFLLNEQSCKRNETEKKIEKRGFKLEDTNEGAVIIDGC